MWNTILYGVTYAFSQAVTYLLYPIVFRFGAFQITLPDDNLASSSFDKIIVVFFALIFGAAGAGQAGAFAPSYAKAKLSASRIFQLLDRVPIIDSYSEDGQKPVCSWLVYFLFLTPSFPPPPPLIPSYMHTHNSHTTPLTPLTHTPLTPLTHTPLTHHSHTTHIPHHSHTTPLTHHHSHALHRKKSEVK